MVVPSGGEGAEGTVFSKRKVFRFRLKGGGCKAHRIPQVRQAPTATGGAVGGPEARGTFSHAFRGLPSAALWWGRLATVFFALGLYGEPGLRRALSEAPASRFLQVIQWEALPYLVNYGIGSYAGGYAR